MVRPRPYLGRICEWSDCAVEPKPRGDLTSKRPFRSSRAKPEAQRTVQSVTTGNGTDFV